MRELMLRQLGLSKVILYGCLFATYALSSTSAMSGGLSMVCKNPWRQYLVRYDARQREFVLLAEEGPTAYFVASVSNGTIFSGKTVADGPDFVAYTTGKKRITYYVNGKHLQTDRCK